MCAVNVTVTFDAGARSREFPTKQQQQTQTKQRKLIRNLLSAPLRQQVRRPWTNCSFLLRLGRPTRRVASIDNSAPSTIIRPPGTVLCLSHIVFVWCAQRGRFVGQNHPNKEKKTNQLLLLHLLLAIPLASLDGRRKVTTNRYVQHLAEDDYDSALSEKERFRKYQ